VLDGRYRLDARIAAGGMGEVWRGADLALNRAVAVKLLHPEHASHPDGLARFRAEARHAGSLSHPNIAQVYDYCEPDPPDPAYLVLELVDGPSLARQLDGGPLSPARALDVIEQAASGLAAAHRSGLLHRDIKPGNLLLSRDGLVKITDFGIARAAGSAVHTRTGALAGTPAYLAPERFGGAPATPATDLYALGVVAHECLTGQVPFAGEPLVVALAHVERDMPPLPASVPGDLAALVTDLTRKDPDARPASAIAVLARAGLARNAVSGPATTAAAGPARTAGPGPATTPALAPAPAETSSAGTSAVDSDAAGRTAAWDTPVWEVPAWAPAAANPTDPTGTSSTGASATGVSSPATSSPATSSPATSSTGTSSTGMSSTRTSPAGISATRTSLTGTSFAGTSAGDSDAAGPTAAQPSAAAAGRLRRIVPSPHGPRWYLTRRAVLVLAGLATAGLASVVIWLLTSGPGAGPVGHRPPSRPPAAQQASPRHSPGPQQAAAAQHGHAHRRGHGPHAGAGHRRQHGHGTGPAQPSPTVTPSTPTAAPTPTEPAVSPTPSAPAATPSTSISGLDGAPSTPSAAPTPTEPAVSPTPSAPAATPSTSISGDGGTPSARLGVDNRGNG
jgi:serine/threonine protein kinase